MGTTTTRRLTLAQKEANKIARAEARKAAKEAARIEAERSQRPVKTIEINIDWYRNRTWGMCPKATVRVRFKDGSSERAYYGGVTGCGYDKESTIVSDIFNDYLKYKLHMIGEKKEHPYGIYLRSDWKCFNGGVGMSCYYPISEYIGGKLTRVSSGKTWDSYEYEDIEGAPIGGEYKEPPSPFAGLVTLAKMMAVVSGDQKEANELQKRIITTGLGPAANFPDDWDSLPEEEKTRRLNAGLEALS